MTDPAQEILTAIQTALNGNLKYPASTGDNWPVYLSLPKSDGYRYVVLTSLNWYDDGGDNDMDCDLTIEVWSGQRYVGQAPVAPMNSISSQIVALLSKKSISMTTYFMRVLPYLEEADIFFDDTGLGVIPRKVLRFRFVCREK